MAEIKYAGEEAVSRIADYVNKKLTFVSAMPASPVDEETVLYVGATTSSYTQGGVYRYDNTSTSWIMINSVKTIELTQSEYDALPTAVKMNGTIYFVTDAESLTNIIEGYYNETDGKFYEESTYTTEITGRAGTIYISLDTNIEYRYDTTNSEFIQVAGSGSGIIYVDALPSTDIEDAVYGLVFSIDHTDTVKGGFLDDNDLFVLVPNGNDYSYIAASGKELEASRDGIEYKKFVSLAYSTDAGKFTLTYGDTTTEILEIDDIFYYKEIRRNYYAGNSEDQTMTALSGSGGGGQSYVAGEGIAIIGPVIEATPASPSTLGSVKIDDKTIQIDEHGVISGNYQGGYGIDVDENEIAAKIFVGSQTDWNALTPTQQSKYDTVNIIDDFNDTPMTPGHTIMDGAGNTYPQRENLVFDGMTVTDDSANDVTKVTQTPYTAGSHIEINNYEVSTDESVKGVFIGTTAEWSNLTTAQKAEYDLVNFTDDLMTGSAVVDTVQSGNMNAITSNAVAGIMNSFITVSGDKLVITI